MKKMKTYLVTVAFPLDYVPDSFVKDLSKFLKRKPAGLEQDLVSKIVTFKYNFKKTADKVAEQIRTVFPVDHNDKMVIDVIQIAEEV